MTDWLVLRVLHGNPFRITDAITELGIGAYCPRYIDRRRMPHDRARIVEVTRPMLPGYVFADEHFDTAHIGPAMLVLAKRRAKAEFDANRRQIPSQIDCSARWLALDGSPIRMANEAMRALVDSETNENSKWRPLAGEIVTAFREIVKGVRKRSKYIRLEDFQLAVA